MILHTPEDSSSSRYSTPGSHCHSVSAISHQDRMGTDSNIKAGQLSGTLLPLPLVTTGDPFQPHSDTLPPCVSLSLQRHSTYKPVPLAVTPLLPICSSIFLQTQFTSSSALFKPASHPVIPSRNHCQLCFHAQPQPLNLLS